jgi:DNA-binding NtrC family response regulator
LLSLYLEDAGLRTSVAAHGRDARRCLAERLIDLVILDLMLPGEDGLALCRELRVHSHIPVIMLTAAAPWWTASSAWRWAQTTTWPSRSTRASCWRGSRWCCAAPELPRARPCG